MLGSLHLWYLLPVINSGLLTYRIVTSRHPVRGAISNDEEYDQGERSSNPSPPPPTQFASHSPNSSSFLTRANPPPDTSTTLPDPELCIFLPRRQIRANWILMRRVIVCKLGPEPAHTLASFRRRFAPAKQQQPLRTLEHSYSIRTFTAAAGAFAPLQRWSLSFCGSFASNSDMRGIIPEIVWSPLLAYSQVNCRSLYCFGPACFLWLRWILFGKLLYIFIVYKVRLGSCT